MTGTMTKYEYKDSYGLGWGNMITALRWNYLITNKLFQQPPLPTANTASTSPSNHLPNLTTKQKEVDYFRYFSGIEDVGAI
ncbi:MAG: hypothetical protein R2758_00760 [Bacteroidales bacterium]